MWARIPYIFVYYLLICIVSAICENTEDGGICKSGEMLDDMIDTSQNDGDFKIRCCFTSENQINYHW